MNRRSFLSQSLQTFIPEKDLLTDDEPVKNEFANKKLPDVPRTNAGLEPYTGAWNYTQASHLLRRTMFGPKKDEINTVLGMTLEQAVDTLLADTAMPAPPLNVSPNDLGAPLGTTWVNATFNQNYEGYRSNSLRSWWIGLMINQPISLREKMVLFWHNHFVTEIVVVNDSRYSYKYNNLLRQNALGNFKSLAKQITVEPSMLEYLNGNTNIKDAPNENYARELLELFTVGKGPIIGPGNYTNYTEDDVIAAAKVLTGWRDDRPNISSVYSSTRHDTSTKQFSSAFGNRTIPNNNELEYQDLVDMIFDQPETAKAICRKLYRWFVYYVIDQTAEDNVITPMASLLIDNNYNIKPVLKALLLSAHFHDPINMGCVIKNPMDFTISVARQYHITFPSNTDFIKQYSMWLFLFQIGFLQQMAVGDPPNVAGWGAYYQEPQYYEIWINAVTLPWRNQYTDIMISNNGYQKDGVKIVIDPIAFAKTTSQPGDCNILIAEFIQLLFPFDITDTQKEFLKETLLPGLPDYEWTQEWNDYIADPNNTTKMNAVKIKLQLLLRAMMGMAEYHLS